MDKLDVKALEFREELIKLCNKYNCKVGGNYNDCNDDYTIEFSDYDYNVKSEGVSIYKTDINDKREYLIDKYILNMFRDEPTEMQGLNNVKVNCIVFSNDSEKANKKMEYILSEHILSDEVHEVRRIKESIKEIRLKNGERYIWVKPNEYSKGYRCNHAFIDRSLSLETIETHIMPTAFYCGKDTVEMF